MFHKILFKRGIRGFLNVFERNFFTVFLKYADT